MVLSMRAKLWKIPAHESRKLGQVWTTLVRVWLIILWFIARGEFRQEPNFQANFARESITAPPDFSFWFPRSDPLIGSPVTLLLPSVLTCTKFVSCWQDKDKKIDGNHLLSLNGGSDYDRCHLASSSMVWNVFCVARIKNKLPIGPISQFFGTLRKSGNPPPLTIGGGMCDYRQHVPLSPSLPFIFGLCLETWIF